MDQHDMMDQHIYLGLNTLSMAWSLVVRNGGGPPGSPPGSPDQIQAHVNGVVLSRRRCWDAPSESQSTRNRFGIKKNPNGLNQQPANKTFLLHVVVGLLVFGWLQKKTPRIQTNQMIVLGTPGYSSIYCPRELNFQIATVKPHHLSETQRKHAPEPVVTGTTHSWS